MKTETVRDDNIPAVLAALRDKLEDTEQEWQDRILDYIAENYPTQANRFRTDKISGRTEGEGGNEKR